MASSENHSLNCCNFFLYIILVAGVFPPGDLRCVPGGADDWTRDSMRSRLPRTLPAVPSDYKQHSMSSLQHSAHNYLMLIRMSNI